MIFTKKVTAFKNPTQETAPWVRRFAFLPKCVYEDKSNNTKVYVWLNLYEVRLYLDSAHGWWREYRVPGAQNFWKEDANSYDF